MARSVYYDPFGARVQGFHAGMQDEMALQDNTRRARAQDFDYNYVKPIELQGLRRQEDYNQYADPYLRRALGLNEEQAQAGTFVAGANARGLAGDITGQYGPAFNYGQQYLGVPQTQGTPEQLMGVSDRFNRDFLAQRGDAERDYQYRLANSDRSFGLNERQQAESEYWARNMNPVQQLYALIQSGAFRNLPGMQQNPGDFPAYAAPQQTQATNAPAYQYPVPQVLQNYGVPQQFAPQQPQQAPVAATDELGRPVDISVGAF